MKRITEKIIEQYIRYPGELSEEEKQAVTQAISQPGEIRQIYDWLSGFYDQLDAIKGRHVLTIPLTFKNFTAAKAGPVALAAKSKTGNEGLKVKAVLVSEKEGVLVRILEHAATQTFSMYVLHKNPQKNTYAILSLQNPNVDFVTDQKGKLQNESSLGDFDWENSHPLLRLSSGNVPLSKKQLADCNISTQILDDVIDITSRDGKLKIELGDNNSGFSKILVVQDGDKQLHQLEEKTTQFETNHLNKPLAVYFYQ